MNAIRNIANAYVAGRTVLVRADLNVPTAGGMVTDTTRIDRFAPTVKELTARGARVVIMSHFGRPKGKRDLKDSLRPVCGALAAALGAPVTFIDDCAGPQTAAQVALVPFGGVALLENLRFYAEEEADDLDFAKKLASFADIFVSDAFSCAHRAHASLHAIATLLPAYAGPAMMAELKAFDLVLENPQRPVAALVGGSKVSSKIDVLQHLLHRVDVLIIGGGMANTFLLAQGKNTGKSLAEPDLTGIARDIMAEAEQRGVKIMLPQDVVLGEKFEANARDWVEDADALTGDGFIFDIGPRAVAALQAELGRCHTLLWNGPLGVFELEPFGCGTFEVARTAAELTKQGKLVTVAGGGDTVAALNAAGVTDSFSYVSAAGGAFLEYIEGKELPGVAILKRAS